MTRPMTSYWLTLGCGHAMRVDRATAPATGRSIYCPACSGRFTIQTVERGRALPKRRVAGGAA